LKGRRKWLQLDGMNAIIVQHELDHLDGKTIMDYKIDVQSPPDVVE